MSNVITTKYPGKCNDCGTALPAGSQARWYKGNILYGIGCHSGQQTMMPGAGKSQLETALDRAVAVASLEPPNTIISAWLEVSYKTGARLISEFKRHGVQFTTSHAKEWQIGKHVLRYHKSHSVWNSPWTLSMANVHSVAAGNAIARALGEALYPGVTVRQHMS